MKSQSRSQVLAVVCVVLGATFLWGCMVSCAKHAERAPADGVRPPEAAPEEGVEAAAAEDSMDDVASYTRRSPRTGRVEGGEKGPRLTPPAEPKKEEDLKRYVLDGRPRRKIVRGRYERVAEEEMPEPAEAPYFSRTKEMREKLRERKEELGKLAKREREAHRRKLEEERRKFDVSKKETIRLGKSTLEIREPPPGPAEGGRSKEEKRAGEGGAGRRPVVGIRWRNGLVETGGRGPADLTVGGKVDAALLARQMAATDELWVIERPSITDARPALDEDAPTQGELRARVPGQAKEVPLPLKHTDVRAEVSAFIATVNVTQQYHNPYGVKIEAVYVFPLPQNAAVTEFVMTIGKRRIRGIIREREEARKIYEEAKRQGYVASLLTQERPNIFTQRVANIEPQKEIDITITYFNTLEYSRGEYEFVFPMVVGPRYNPPGSKDGVGAVARGAHGGSGQPVEVQYLKPGERSGHDISVTLDIDAGVEVEQVTSPSHAVEVERLGPSLARVRLSRLDAIPNKDLVVRYKVAGKKLKTALMTHRGEKGNHFVLVLQPPAELSYLRRVPREMVFVLDCSGSMRGRPMGKAKEAIRRCLKKLDADDTFQVIRFSSNASKLGRAPLAATPANVERALRFVDGLRGSGGTRMIEGIKAALDFAHDPQRFRVVSFMTDGYIGNESQILAAVHQKLGASRIFSFGVGNSVNRHLLESMARMGRGAVAFVGLDEGAGREVDLFYDRCSRPALTDIEIDWGGMEVDSIYPRRTPDLFVGRPVLITGRFTGGGPTTVRVMGRTGSYEQAFSVDVDLDDETARHAGVTKLWARKKLAELAATHTHSPSRALRDEMTALSLEYSVQCRYTAFLAVDSSRRTAGAHGVSVKVPVLLPDGVEYETTVDE